MSKETFDPKIYNVSKNKAFSEVAEVALSRRSFLKGSAGAAALSVFGGSALTACSDGSSTPAASGTADRSTVSLGFSSIAGSKTDAVVVPEGYTASVLVPWGTPLNTMASAYNSDGMNTSSDQANSVGMHHDGMFFYPINGSSTDGILCINHEYIDQNALHPTGKTTDSMGNRTVIDEVRKEINAHGVTVVRVRLENGKWVMVENDPLNRRITGYSEIDVSGPVAAAAATKLVTRFSTDGSLTRGTFNNCGNGFTPWGTYLTCEENWPGYFVNTGTRSTADVRLGISDDETRYDWEDFAGDSSEVADEFARFVTTPTGASATDDYRNEANGHGYVVEIDPYNPASRPVKRTALGRFRHECCNTGRLVAGQPVTFYSGHDGRFEYIYKFVSSAVWDPADANPTDRLATGAKYMDEGTLYVARFNEDGTGTWLPLTMDSRKPNGDPLSANFDSLADIILNSPGAADLLGATPMDRPEWTTVDPFTGSIYFTLTNNTRRTFDNAANPRVDNPYGHVIRWDEGESLTRFDWNIFVFGSPDDGDANTNRSGLTADNQFASPDGMLFDPRGILWLQTDNGADAVEEDTNDQMLAVIPSQLRDANGNQVGITADNQAELKRFFVGPNSCEVTGLAYTPDMTTFFINIQHPGNWPFDADDATMAAPAGTTVRPRAATVVVRRNDGGPVGE